LLNPANFRGRINLTVSGRLAGNNAHAADDAGG